MIMCALEQELRARVGTAAFADCTGLESWFLGRIREGELWRLFFEVQPTEGPFGLIIAPSRELAHQTYEAGPVKTL